MAGTEIIAWVGVALTLALWGSCVWRRRHRSVRPFPPADISGRHPLDDWTAYLLGPQQQLITRRHGRGTPPPSITWRSVLYVASGRHPTTPTITIYRHR